jgi:hypothetical protein
LISAICVDAWPVIGLTFARHVSRIAVLHGHE